MADLFDNKILCGKCNLQMKSISIAKNGFILRAVECSKCGSKIIHPHDEQEYKDFVELKKKEFSVKMRFVGNSYAVSIPKEIVNFMQEQEKVMDDMVRLSLQEFGRISLCFGHPQQQNNPQHPSHVQDNNLKEKLNKGELN